MKVYYINNHKDGTGWSHAGINYMLALDAAGVEVVARHLKLNNVDGEVPEKIKEFESRNPQGSDIVIQHTLPHFMDRARGIKNIGLYFLETSNCMTSSWPSRLNTMDHLITSNKEGAESAKYSGVKTPISVVGIPTDLSKYERDIEPFNFPGINDHFKFYYIAEAGRRKNIAALIKAFELEFNPLEPVSLVLKVSYPGQSPQQAQQNIKQYVQEIRNGLKLRRQKSNILTITNMMTEEQILRLHRTCNVHVCPSFGEAWNVPSLDAMGFGNPTITTKNIGTNEFVNNSNGWLVDSYDEPAFGFDGFGDVWVGNENVKSISIPHLCQCMRQAYNNYNEKSLQCLEDVKIWGYEAIGQKLKGIINGIS